MPRCPNGTRRNKRTGNCEPTNVTREPANVTREPARDEYIDVRPVQRPISTNQITDANIRDLV